MSDDDSDDDNGKAKFEAERDKILSDLPQNLKDKFGEIGFVLVEDDGDDEDDDEDKKVTPQQPKEYYQPALIVNPYEVPPKPVRDIYWFQLYQKAKRSKAKLAAMDYLVYIYGSDDADDCYNFVSQEEFLSLKDAQEQGLDKLPAELEEKKQSAGKLSDVEATLVRGFEEMQHDINKEPTDRKPQYPSRNMCVKIFTAKE
ncbi:hypothetical protein IV203_030564 [Nitzschia inconspicua]|uniref:Uncharacterized protein n=1 Tax=Nitzschia inconspicua TaxID=303405 RepID=A0A9K3KCZ7_9STRA|nr:hypothetical protein IV203_022901 [Nitzschia inconspicua]KAG7367821.1 hypothetical protein IV203_030564 [Nitzschia inconspicua]